MVQVREQRNETNLYEKATNRSAFLSFVSQLCMISFGRTAQMISDSTIQKEVSENRKQKADFQRIIIPLMIFLQAFPPPTVRSLSLYMYVADKFRKVAKFENPKNLIMRLINSFGSFYSHVLLEHTYIIDHALLPFHVSCFMFHVS